jgi:hypothetical protein
MSNITALDGFFQGSTLKATVDGNGAKWNCTVMGSYYFTPRYQRTLLCREVTVKKEGVRLCNETVEAIGLSIRSFFTANGCMMEGFDDKLHEFQQELNPSRDADCISGEENEPGSCGKELDLVR